MPFTISYETYKLASRWLRWGDKLITLIHAPLAVNIYNFNTVIYLLRISSVSPASKSAGVM